MDNVEKELKDLAISDWEQFIQIVGDDFMVTAKARLLRLKGKSWQQISIKLETTPAKARTLAKAVKFKQPL